MNENEFWTCAIKMCFSLMGSPHSLSGPGPFTLAESTSTRFSLTSHTPLKPRSLSTLYGDRRNKPMVLCRRGSFPRTMWFSPFYCPPSRCERVSSKSSHVVSRGWIHFTFYVLWNVFGSCGAQTAIGLVWPEAVLVRGWKFSVHTSVRFRIPCTAYLNKRINN